MPGSVIDINDHGGITIDGITPSEDIFCPTYRCKNSDITYPYTVGEDDVLSVS